MAQLLADNPHLPTASARRFGYDNSLQLNEQLLSRVSFEHAADQVRLAVCNAWLVYLQVLGLLMQLGQL